MFKNTILSLVIILLANNYSLAQLYRVVNPQNEPIPFTTVFEPGTENGDLTDENGIFRYTPNKVVVLSSLGYKTDTVTLKPSPHTSLLILQTDNKLYEIERPEMLVIQKEIGSWKSGHFLEKRKEYYYLASDNVTLLSKVTNKQNAYAEIKKAYFDLKISKQSSIRVRVLSVDKQTGGPGKDLLRENVIVNETNLIGYYKVNLAQYNIIMPPEGVYIGFDLLPLVELPNLVVKVGLGTETNSKDSYIGTVTSKKWTSFNNRIKSQASLGNFRFGVKAVY
ncbi:hypothetical protein C9994_05075 [Marivirga lumbricoides]|uniref:Carboxypeptidase-like regulatory domain-containing protein n=1 Tax=Marivirga lumbricoides TaxID=1046115 RepID=A0A2T4DSY4_9BACT|nr:hypothetical protein C9994_05075 [Marivirga lumbricoides]